MRREGVIGIVVLWLCISALGKLQRIELKGERHGGYYLSIYVGVPPVKEEHLLIDTGSWWTLFPCSTCLKCNGKLENFYDP